MSIPNILLSLKSITPTIKNKYVAYDDLKMLIGELNDLLVVAQVSHDEMLVGPHVGLDKIFPAIDHLKLYLNEKDLGAIALTSKPLYDLMVLNFTELVTRINILKHYIYCRNTYNVNIKFNVDNNELLVPIPINIIMHKQLKNILGCDEYYKTINWLSSGYVFSKKDLLHFNNNYKNVSIDLMNLICVFCKKFKHDNDHNNCAINYYGDELKIYTNDTLTSMNLNFRGHILLWTKYMYPELEYIEKSKKHKMLDTMKGTCEGKFNGQIYSNNQCSKCNTLTFYHNLNYED